MEHRLRIRAVGRWTEEDFLSGDSSEERGMQALLAGSFHTRVLEGEYSMTMSSKTDAD